MTTYNYINSYENSIWNIDKKKLLKYNINNILFNFIWKLLILLYLIRIRIYTISIIIYAMFFYLITIIIINKNSNREDLYSKIMVSERI